MSTEAAERTKRKGSARAAALIARREFSQLWRGAAFWITTALGVLLILGLSFAPTFFNWLRARETVEAVVVDETGAFAPRLGQALAEMFGPAPPIRLAVEKAAPRDQGGPGAVETSALDDRVRRGEIDAYLLIQPQAGDPAPRLIWVSRQANASALQALAQAATAAALPLRLQSLAISPDAAAALSRPVNVDVRNLEERFQRREEAVMSMGMIYVLLFVIYMTTIIYGSMIANSVVAEKSARVVELLLTAARPRDVLAGKVAGVGLAALFQYTAWLLAGVVILLVRQRSAQLTIGGVPVDLAALPPATLGYFLLFATLAYALYALLYATAASLAARPEEASAPQMPVIFLLVAMYGLSLPALSNPTGNVATVASLIPFFTPMLMFTRVALSAVPVWQVLLSVALTCGTLLMLLALGERIYRRTLLHYGRAPSWGAALRMMTGRGRPE